MRQGSHTRPLHTLTAAMLSYLLLVGQLAPLAHAWGGPAGAGGPEIAGKGEQRLTPAEAGASELSARPGPAPAPLVMPLQGTPTITATKTDNTPQATQKMPGDTITYDVVISNTGTGPATGVMFNDTVDANTTLVPGSVQTQPIALADTYNVIGNVRIQPNAAQGLLANDRDPDTGNNTGLTASGPTTSTQGGNVTINADGSFSYNPPVGFAGTDTFSYTVMDANFTDTATVTLFVGNGTATPGTNVIWFVNPAAAAGGDGRLTNPFNCYTGANSGAQTCFSATAADDPGDNIFLYSGMHTGGNTLLNNQKLIGAGATATLASIAVVTVEPYSDPLPATGGTSPMITTSVAATNAVNLGQGNILRGFMVGATTGAKIFGNNFGMLTVGNNVSPDVALGGAGQALNLTMGTFVATSGFNGVATTSSGTQGITLAGVAGAVLFGGTQVSGSTTQGILVGTTTADINFGNTIVSGGSDGVSFQNNSMGTRTFGALTVSGGTGTAFLHGAGGGNVTVNNLATLTTGASNTIDIQNQAVSTTVNFAGGATLAKTAGGGTGVNLGTDNGNVTFGGTLTIGTSGARFPSTAVTITGGTTGVFSLGAVSIFTNNQPGIVSTNADGTLNSTSGTVDVNAATALNLDGPAGITTLGMTLTTVNSTGGTNNVTLTEVGGTLNIQGGALSGATGAAFAATTTTATVTCAASITNTTGGVSLTNNTGGTFTFSGGLNLSTGAGTAFNATGGGTVNATQNNTTIVNTLTTTTGAALNVVNTNIGASNLTFRSIASNGAASGIVLNNTGSAGGLVVTGNSSGNCGGAVTANSGGTPGTATAPAAADCTGGVIQNSTGPGISLTSTAKVSLTRMRVNNGADDGIRGSTVTDFSLISSLVETNGNVVNEHGIDMVQLLGTSAITNSTVRTSAENNLFVNNNAAGTLTAFNITGSQFSNTTAAAPGADGILIKPESTSNVTVSVSGSFFSNNRDDHLQLAPTANATSKITVNNNTFTDNTATTLGGGITINPVTNTLTTAIVTNNDMSGSVLSAINFNLGVDSTLASRLHATCTGNFIGNTGVANSGSETADGIQVTGNGAGTINAVVSNNDVRQYTNPYGVHVFSRDGDGFINLTMKGNTVAEPASIGPAGFVIDGVRLEAGAVTGDGGTVCADVGDVANASLKNNVLTSGNEAAGGSDIRVRLRIDARMTFPGYGGGGTDTTAVQTYLASRNILDSVSATNASSAANAFGNAGAGCTQPSTAPDIIEVTGTETAPGEIPNGGQSQQPDGSAPIMELQPDAPPSVSSTGAAPSAAVLPSLEVRKDEVIPASRDWRTRNNPLDLPRSKRDGGATFSYSAAPTSAPLAPAQTSASQDKGGKNGGGTSSAPPRPARPKPVKPGPPPGPLSGENFGVNIGTLNAGDSVTIRFQVTIDTPFPSGDTQVSNQGTVSGSNFSNVVTNDPDTAAPNDPTVTLVAPPPDITVRDAKAAEPSSGSTNMVFTVTLSNAPATMVSVNFTTADEPPGPGKAVAGMDYTPTNGTVTFMAGQRVKTINVPVLADADNTEMDETFLVNLSGAMGGNITDPQAVGTITIANPPGTVLITELRTSGVNGAGDDFVEIFNNSASTLNVQASDASAGYALAVTNNGCMGDPVIVGVIPNGTMIPPRGHYLFVGSTYSLGAYAAGNATLTANLNDDANVAIFTTADLTNLSSVTRLDAVGFGLNTSDLCDLMREGTTIAPASGSTSQYSFVRKFTQPAGVPTATDANNNETDFNVVSTTPSTPVGSNAAPKLGAPGPENLAGPRQKTLTQFPAQLIDPALSASQSPNRVRDLTPDAPNNSTFGTIAIRRTFTNNTGVPVTRLRFRIFDISSFPSPMGTADVRARTSGTTTVTVTGGGSVTVQGTTLETPPAQPSGGALNSSLAAGTVTTGTPLANGASINVQFLLGVQQNGTFRIFVIVEALP